MATVSRLEFLKLSGSALVGLGAGHGLIGAGWPTPPQRLTAELFRPHVNSNFAVKSAAGTPTVLALAKVTERAFSGRVEQFSLLLHGSAAEPLADGIYSFQHPSLGRMELCINKVGPNDPRRADYQACFGYLRA